MFDHICGNEMFTKAQPEPPLAELCANPTHPAISDQGAEPSTSICTSPPQGAAGSSEATPWPPSVQTGQLVE